MKIAFNLRVKASSHIDDTTRHDSMRHDTKARQILSLVPHISRHDHATSY